MRLLLLSLLSLSLSLPFALCSVANDAACAALATQQGWPPLTPVPRAAVPPGFCASIWQTESGRVRGLLVLPLSKGLLSVDANSGSVIWSQDTNNDGKADNTPAERSTLLTRAGLNHGIAYWRSQNRLLVSTVTTVYSWPFDLNNPQAPITAEPTIIVSGIPSAHGTMTIVVDPNEEWLYANVGADGNIDTDITNRCLIRRFRLSSIPTGGWRYADGETWASGLRNEVALAFDRYGVLWGAENGADSLVRDDVGGDVHSDNPAEEINKFAEQGKFYGYPYCFSEYRLPPQYSQGPGSQWVWPQFLNDGTHSDAWCRNPANVVRPEFAMVAHTAPLGMAFVDSTNFAAAPADQPFLFPPAADGSNYLYVGQHGSWNAQPAVGYRVQRFKLTDRGAQAGGLTLQGAQAEDVFKYNSNTAQTGSDWRMRPVDVQVGSDGTLFISNDVGNIVALRYVRTANQQATSSGSDENPDLVFSSSGGLDDGGDAAVAMPSACLLTLVLAAVTACIGFA